MDIAELVLLVVPEPANSEDALDNAPLLSGQGALSSGLASLAPVTSQDQGRGGSRCCIVPRAEHEEHFSAAGDDLRSPSPVFLTPEEARKGGPSS